uniref:RNA-dependent RNA polymerase n=1 Tax=Toxocara canis TaxID=6265 RepID=A0A183USC9_TOXCA
LLECVFCFAAYETCSFQVPGPAPTLYPVGSVAYRQAVQQFDQSIVSTDSESMISDMRGLPIHMKGGMSRRTYQQQYLMPQELIKLLKVAIHRSLLMSTMESGWVVERALDSGLDAR